MKRTRTGLTFNSEPLQRAFLVWGRGYQELADLAGCAVATAHNVVTGRCPTSKFARRIAGILGVDLAACWKTEDAA